MGNGLPSLPFFTSDFLIAVATWPTERVGAYCLALFYQWEHGSLPADDASALALILHTTPTRARKLWSEIASKFQVVNGLARNLRLEEHRKEVEAKVAKSSDRGTKGARALWHKRRLSDAQASAQAVPQAEPKQSVSDGNQNQSQNQNQDPPIKNDPVVEVLRVPPQGRTREPGAMGGSYAAQSQIAYSHRGHTLYRSPWSEFIKRFDGDDEAARSWLDAEIDTYYADGFRPGNMLKFIDERWEVRGASRPKQTTENIANLSAFVQKVEGRR